MNFVWRAIVFVATTNVAISAALAGDATHAKAYDLRAPWVADAGSTDATYTTSAAISDRRNAASPAARVGALFERTAHALRGTLSRDFDPALCLTGAGCSDAGSTDRSALTQRDAAATESSIRIRPDVFRAGVHKIGAVGVEAVGHDPAWLKTAGHNTADLSAAGLSTADHNHVDLGEAASERSSRPATIIDGVWGLQIAGFARIAAIWSVRDMHRLRGASFPERLPQFLKRR